MFFLTVLGLLPSASACPTYSVYDIATGTTVTMDSKLNVARSVGSPTGGILPGMNEILRINLSVPSAACVGATISDVRYDADATDGANSRWPIDGSMLYVDMYPTGGALLDSLLQNWGAFSPSVYRIGYGGLGTSIVLAPGAFAPYSFFMDTSDASAVADDEITGTMTTVSWSDGTHTVTQRFSVAGYPLTH